MMFDSCCLICSFEFCEGVVGVDEVFFVDFDGLLILVDEVFVGWVFWQFDWLCDYFGKSGQIVMVMCNIFLSLVGIVLLVLGFLVFIVVVMKVLGVECDGVEFFCLLMFSGLGLVLCFVFGGYVEWLDCNEG